MRLTHALTSPPRPLPSQGRCALLYHGVTGEQAFGANLRFNSRFVSAQRLAGDIALLAAQPQVRFVPLADLLTEGEGFRVALTFDDGYCNLLHHALPVLEAAEVPATFFITTARVLPGGGGEPLLWADRIDLAAQLQPGPLHLGEERFVQDRHRQWRREGDGVALKQLCRERDNLFLCELAQALPMEAPLAERPELEPYWRLLNEEELQRLAHHPLIELGAHGVTHIDLPALSSADARWELRNAKRWLELVSGREVTQWAYPRGAYSPALLRMAAATGYRLQALVDENAGEGGLRDSTIVRLGIHPYLTSRGQLNAIAAGGYGRR